MKFIKNIITDLTSNDRLKFRTITTIDVHARDIIEGFVRDNVTEAAEFEWESQLRFYWLKADDNLWIKQCTGKRNMDGNTTFFIKDNMNSLITL